MMQSDNLESKTCNWRVDIDSLAFYPSPHSGSCVVHRLAFRALLGWAPTPEDCVDYFTAHREIFVAAAQAKTLRRNIVGDASFHLNSRDINNAKADPSVTA